MPDISIPEAKDNEPISAAAWNAMRRAVLRAQLHVDPKSGMEAHQDEGGTSLGGAFPAIVIYKSTGTISARSGTTPGYGNANIVTATHTSLASVVTGATVIVHNLIPTSVGSGKYGVGGIDEHGLHWAIFEC